MQRSEWLKIKEIFYQALDLPAIEREKFLATQNDLVRSEVSELMIDAEGHLPLCDMASQKRRLLEQIEHRRPARNLRMPVAARMVLPLVSIFVGHRRRAHRPCEYGRPIHHGYRNG